MLSLLAAAAALLSLSNPIAFQVEVVDKAGVRVSESVLVAEPRAILGSAAASDVRVPVHHGLATLHLEPGVWRLTALRKGWWCWSQEITVQAGATEPQWAALELSPTGRIAGRLALAPGESPPDEMSLRVRRDTDASSWSEPVADVVPCPVVAGAQWVCEIPAGVLLDLELEMDPFSPRYFWDIEVGEDQTRDIGPIPLVRGASLSGWVVGEDGRAASVPARVELRAPDDTPLEGFPLEEASEETTRFKAPTNPKGFFQLLQLTPGHYRLAVTAGLLGSSATAVEVRESVETRLRDPLVLAPPAALRLSLTPARHPNGDAWLIRLYVATGSLKQYVVWDGEVSEDGTWCKPDLPAGEYRLQVLRGDGGIWFNDIVRLEPGADDRELQVAMTRVSGTVKLGESPLVGAEVMLTDKGGKLRAPFWTNKEGRFSGIFPAVDLDRARWRADIETIHPLNTWDLAPIHPDGASESSLRFSLTIPDTSIKGKVVDEQGTPRRAIVTAIPQTGSEAEAANLLDTDTDEVTGEFVMTGLKDGEYQVFARSPVPGDPPRRTLTSPSTKVSIGPSESPSPLTLVVTEETQIVGRVTTSNGVAVPGAEVLVIPVDTATSLAKPVRTDVEGRFLASVAPATRNVLIDVSAPGIGRRILGRSVAEARRLTLELDPTGRLVFDLSDSQQAGPSAAALYHDGGWVGLVNLARWSQLNGEPTEPGVFRVPFMHVGPYRVCQVSGVEEYAQLMAGTLSESRCDQGTLRPGTDLLLRVFASPRSD